MKAAPWTADEWSDILWYAREARTQGGPPYVRRLAAAHLREIALQSEILSQRAHDRAELSQ